MTQQDIEASSARARIDGGFSFTLAVFAVGLGLIAVLERVGLPEQALKLCVCALILGGFVLIAAIMRSMRPVDFHAGGRILPAPYAGLAYAGLSAGLFLPFLPPLPAGLGLNSLVAGFAAGLILCVLATGPYLRRSAAFSPADFIGSRFPDPFARSAIAVIAAICAALVAIGGYAFALRAFLAITGASHGLGAAVLGIVLVLLIVPSGLSGVIWVAAGAAVVTMAALGLPILSMLREPTSWMATATRFSAMTGANPRASLDLPVMIALALGLAALGPLLGPAVAGCDGTRARRSGFFALLLIAVTAVLGAMTMAGSTAALDAAFAGRDLGKLPADLFAANENGGMSICGIRPGTSNVIVGSCTAKNGSAGLRPQDNVVSAEYLLQSFPSLRRQSGVLASLAAVFAVTLGLAVAAAGAQSFATSLGHDLLYSKRRHSGPASQRLAIARALAILLIGFCSAWPASGSADPRLLITLALTVSATLLTPLLALSLVAAATSFDALMALLVAALMIARFALSDSKGWTPNGLASEVIFAAAAGLSAGIILSFLHGRGLPVRTRVVAAPRDKPPSAS